MSYYTIGEFAKKVGLSINTLRNWDKDGKLKPSYISSGGHRYYSDEQLNRLIGIKLDKQERITIVGFPFLIVLAYEIDAST